MALTFFYDIVGRTFQALFGRLRSDAHKDVEIAVVRNDLAVLRRQVKRAKYSPADQAVLATLAQLLHRRLWHNFVVKPEKIVVGTDDCLLPSGPIPAWTRPGLLWDQHLVDIKSQARPFGSVARIVRA